MRPRNIHNIASVLCLVIVSLFGLSNAAPNPFVFYEATVPANMQISGPSARAMLSQGTVGGEVSALNAQGEFPISSLYDDTFGETPYSTTRIPSPAAEIFHLGDVMGYDMILDTNTLYHCSLRDESTGDCDMANNATKIMEQVHADYSSAEYLGWHAAPVLHNGTLLPRETSSSEGTTTFQTAQFIPVIFTYGYNSVGDKYEFCATAVFDALDVSDNHSTLNLKNVQWCRVVTATSGLTTIPTISVRMLRGLEVAVSLPKFGDGSGGDYVDRLLSFRISIKNANFESGTATNGEYSIGLQIFENVPETPTPHPGLLLPDIKMSPPGEPTVYTMNCMNTTCTMQIPKTATEPARTIPLVDITQGEPEFSGENPYWQILDIIEANPMKPTALPYLQDDDVVYADPQLIIRYNATIMIMNVRELAKHPLIFDVGSSVVNPSLVWQRAIAPLVHRNIVSVIPFYSIDSFSMWSSVMFTSTLPGFQRFSVVIEVSGCHKIMTLVDARDPAFDHTVVVDSAHPSINMIIPQDGASTGTRYLQNPMHMGFEMNIMTHNVRGVPLYDVPVIDQMTSLSGDMAPWGHPDTAISTCPPGMFIQTGRCEVCPPNFACPGDGMRLPCHSVNGHHFVGQHRCSLEKSNATMNLIYPVSSLGADYFRGFSDTLNVVSVSFDFTSVERQMNVVIQSQTPLSGITAGSAGNSASIFNLAGCSATDLGENKYRFQIRLSPTEFANNRGKRVPLCFKVTAEGELKRFMFNLPVPIFSIPGIVDRPSFVIKPNETELECIYSGEAPGSSVTNAACPKVATTPLARSALQPFRVSLGNSSANIQGHGAGFVPMFVVSALGITNGATIGAIQPPGMPVRTISTVLDIRTRQKNIKVKIPQTKYVNTTTETAYPSYLITYALIESPFELQKARPFISFTPADFGSRTDAPIFAVTEVSNAEMTESLLNGDTTMDDMDTDGKRELINTAMEDMKARHEAGTLPPAEAKKMLELMRDNKETVLKDTPADTMRTMREMGDMMASPDKSGAMDLINLGKEAMAHARDLVSTVSAQADMDGIRDDSLAMVKKALSAARNNKDDMLGAEKHSMRHQMATMARDLSIMTIPVDPTGSVVETEVDTGIKIKAVRLPPPAAGATTTSDVGSTLSPVTKGLKLSVAGDNVTGESVAAAVTVSSSDVFGEDEQTRGTETGKMRHLVSPQMTLEVDGISTFDLKGLDLSEAREMALKLRETGVISNKVTTQSVETGSPFFLGTVSDTLSKITDTLFGWLMPEEGDEKVGEVDITSGIEVATVDDSNNWTVTSASVTADSQDNLAESNLAGLSPDSLAGSFALWMAEEGITVNLEPFTKPFEYASKIPDHPQALYMSVIVILIYIVLFILFFKLDQTRMNRLKQMSISYTKNVQDVELADEDNAPSSLSEEEEEGTKSADSEDSILGSQAEVDPSTQKKKAEERETSEKWSYPKSVRRRFRRSITSDHSTMNLVADPIKTDMKYLRRRMPRTQKLTCYILLIMVAWVTAAMFYNTSCAPGSTSVKPLECKEYSTGQTMLIAFVSAVIAAFSAGLVAFFFGHTYLKGEKEGSIPWFDEQRLKLMKKLKPNTEKKLNPFMKFLRAITLPFVKLNLALSKIRFPNWTRFIWYVIALALLVGCILSFCLFGVYFGVELGNQFVIACLMSSAQDLFIVQPLKVVAVAILGPIMEILDITELLG